MLTPLVIFAIGLCLSAFFSGSETGFYRVARMRLLIDAIDGGWISRGLLFASNNPAAFVATALVGNNVANYVTSVAVVMGASRLAPGVGWAELVAPIVVAPIVFIYGELLPKNLFFQAPYRLLRRCAPALAVSAVLFAPVSLVLWLVSVALQKLGRAPSQTLRMEIARRELGAALDEGEALGLLSPVQRRLAEGTFALGGKPIREFMVPAARQAKATTRMSRDEVLRLASKLGQPVLPVEEVEAGREIVGYVSAIDCRLDPRAVGLPLRTLSTAEAGETYLAVLLRLQTEGAPIAAVVDTAGRTLGFVTTERLRAAMLQENAA